MFTVIHKKEFNEIINLISDDKIEDYVNKLVGEENILLLQEILINHKDEDLCKFAALAAQEKEDILRIIFEIAPIDYDWTGFLQVIGDDIGESQLGDSEFYKLTTTIINAARDTNPQVYNDMVELVECWKNQ